jgi:hypothetical protein
MINYDIDVQLPALAGAILKLAVADACVAAYRHGQHEQRAQPGVIWSV